jgi:hypothetical protein
MALTVEQEMVIDEKIGSMNKAEMQTRLNELEEKSEPLTAEEEYESEELEDHLDMLDDTEGVEDDEDDDEDSSEQKENPEYK